jgi:predicted ATPase/class 3 adenylate cyclase
MSTLPTGTVTFMFTDIEDSTGVLRDLGDEAFSGLVEQHNRLIRGILAARGGVEVATEGDSFFAVFTDASEAVLAAIDIQRSLGETWVGDRPPDVRIGLHTGNGVLGGDNYVGVDVHKASRVASAGHGGQIVASDITAQLVGSRLPESIEVRPLGKYELAGFSEPETIHQLTATGLRSDFAALRASRATSRLPVPLTNFVGREQEMETGSSALRAYRLLTLTGPGGTGKTRLSIELARRAEAEFPDGVFFVPLAPIRATGLIATTILDVLGLKTTGDVDPADHLERFLSSRTVLLVLDNFEQLVDGSALVSRLLSGAPGLKMIVSSRVPLRVGGERELPVPPLEVPELGFDHARLRDVAGVQLFAHRAQAVRPDFQLDESNVGTIATITRELDGLPLAIELAAARIRSLTPELILERLGNQLLTSASTDLPERQQTIVNAIGWSYDLLDESMRLLFESLSVFTGTFGLREAESVCTVGDGAVDVLEGISQLVEHSLLRPTETSGDPRFRMLTVIREFGYAALVSRGEEEGLLDRYTETYLRLAEQSEKEILTSRQEMWLHRLSADHDNLRAVYDRAMDRGDATSALRLVAALWRFWQIRGHLHEAVDRTERALAMPGETTPIARARALTGLGGIRYWQGHWDHTLLDPYQQALEIFRAESDDLDTSEALYNLAFPLGYMGRFDEAEALLKESLAISERIGRQIGVGRAYWGLANVDGHRDDFSSSIENSERSIEIFSGLDAPFDLGWAWFMVAHGRSKMGDLAGTRPALRTALETFVSVVDMSALALITEMMSSVALAGGDKDGALFLAGAAHRLKMETGAEIGDVQLNQYPEIVDLVQNRDEQDELAFQRGRAAQLEEVVDEARRILS